jgi:hypothetical protein
MSSSGTLDLATLVRTDISEELISSIIRVTRIGELGTALVVPSNRRKPFLCIVIQLQVTATVPSSLILVSLMM